MIFAEATCIMLQSEKKILTFVAGWRRGDNQEHPGGKRKKVLIKNVLQKVPSSKQENIRASYPLYPGVLENLSGTETFLGVPYKQFGNEVFGAVGNVSPIFLWKVILALLDALKQGVLGGTKKKCIYFFTFHLK